MRTIAVTNHKGGSAKTTTAVNIAAALGETGRRVLVIDLDPQGSASSWLGVSAAPFGVIEAIRGRSRLGHLVHETTAPRVQLVPASPELAATSRDEETEIALGLMRAMERLPALWDVVLVDCPPSLGYLAIAPLTVVQEALVPVEAHVLAMAGISSLLETMERIQARLNPGLRLGAVLACRVNRTSHTRAIVERLGERFPEVFMHTRIRESIRLAEAPSFHLPITQYAPDSAGAQDYRAAAAELMVAERPVASRPEQVVTVDVRGPAVQVPTAVTSRLSRLVGTRGSGWQGDQARPTDRAPHS